MVYYTELVKLSNITNSYNLKKKTKITQELYFGVASGHFPIGITLQKNLDASYWWLPLFKNTTNYCPT
jgi:hypothetical protein